MTYSPSDLETAARHVKEGREQVDALTAAVMDARQAGRPTYLSESALITMLTTLEHMVRHEEDIRVSLARVNSANLGRTAPARER